MKKVSNKNCCDYVRCKQNFQGSNLNGLWIGDNYVVMSYGWYPLFIYSKTDNVWYENKDKYSVSTSKQRTQSHPGCVLTHKLGLEQMKEIMYKKSEGAINEIDSSKIA